MVELHAPYGACLSRIKQIPAIPKPSTICGRNGAGQTFASTSGSTRKLVNDPSNRWHSHFCFFKVGSIYMIPRNLWVLHSVIDLFSDIWRTYIATTICPKLLHCKYFISGILRLPYRDLSIHQCPRVIHSLWTNIYNVLIF